MKVSWYNSISVGPRDWSAVFQSVDGVRLIDRCKRICHGSIRDKEGVQIHAGLALSRGHPKFYADTVELQGHGGAVVLRRVLRRVLEAERVWLNRGVFTPSFLNGRMDLTQAEDYLRSNSSLFDRVAQAALEQLEGVLSRSFNGLHEFLK